MLVDRACASSNFELVVNFPPQHRLYSTLRLYCICLSRSSYQNKAQQWWHHWSQSPMSMYVGESSALTNEQSVKKTAEIHRLNNIKRTFTLNTCRTWFREFSVNMLRIYVGYWQQVCLTNCTNVSFSHFYWDDRVGCSLLADGVVIYQVVCRCQKWIDQSQQAWKVCYPWPLHISHWLNVLIICHCYTVNVCSLLIVAIGRSGLISTCIWTVGDNPVFYVTPEVWSPQGCWFRFIDDFVSNDCVIKRKKTNERK